MTDAMSTQEQSARRFLGIAATLGVIGVATNLNGDGTLPKILVAAALVALVWSIHRFGRLGADRVMVFAAPEGSEAPRKKKKKKRTVDPEAPPPA